MAVGSKELAPVELDTFENDRLVDELKRLGVLTKETHGVVIRLAPPLVIRKKHLRRALDAVIDVVRAAEVAR